MSILRAVLTLVLAAAPATAEPAAVAAQRRAAEEWTRNKVEKDLATFTAWAATEGLAPAPTRCQVWLDPNQLKLFLRGAPQDPRSSLALGALLLQDWHPREALAPLARASREP